MRKIGFILLFVVAQLSGLNIEPEVTPYLLPDNHPIKPHIDKIFSKKLVKYSEKSLKHAGFKIISKDRWSPLCVVSHSKMKGFLVKLYLDNQKIEEPWKIFLNRVLGSNAVHDVVHKYDLFHFFKIPRKWIYPVVFLDGREVVDFVLVVEDMFLIKDSKNVSTWKSQQVTPEFLESLYIVLRDTGLIDCVYPFNLPFSIDGKVAFIDTEHYHMWPVPFHRLTPHLSKSNQEFWKTLILNGGPSI